MQARKADVVIAACVHSTRLATLLGDAIPLEIESGYNTTLPPGTFDLHYHLIFDEQGFVVTPLSTKYGCAELGGLKVTCDSCVLRQFCTSPGVSCRV